MEKTALLRFSGHFRDAAMPASVVRMPQQDPIGAHRHEFVEIAVVLGGWGIHVTGSVRHEIRAGDVLVIHGKRSHAYELTRALNLVNVLIPEREVNDAATMLGSLPGYHPLFTFEFARWSQKQYQARLRLGFSDLKRIAVWIEELEKELDLEGLGNPFLAKAWLLQIIGLIARRYGSEAVDSTELHMRLGRVLARLDMNPSETLSLAEMATAAGMSERSFLRYFKKATGDSPAEYCIKNRIKAAQNLLMTAGRDLGITEIAFRCGFNDSNYFSRQFKRVTGMSPRSYRVS